MNNNQIVGYDTQTGAPIYAKEQPMNNSQIPQQNEQNVQNNNQIVGYDTQTGAPIYAKEQPMNNSPIAQQNEQNVQNNNQIVGYDTQTGSPIYAKEQPMNNSPIAQQNEQNVQNNNQIVGYDTQTGAPIYAKEQPMNNSPIAQQNEQNIQNNNQIVGYDTQTGAPIYAKEQPMNNNSIPPSNKKKNNLPPIIIACVVVIIIIIGLISFLGGNSKSLSRTVMIYMVGADLESKAGLATVDLDGIEYNLMDNKNINVVLIAGGSKYWDNDYIDADETSIYELKNSGFEKVNSQNIKDMGDYQVFSDFLNYVYNNYKTDKYDLIFWNHGGAILGSEFDELSKENLSLEDWRDGLENSPFNEDNKLEMIIFSTCLNGTIEVADVFVDYADYLVASEETTIGTTLDGELKYINDIESSDSSYDIALKYIDAYKQKIDNYQSVYKAYYGEEYYLYSTYSIVDLSKIRKLTMSVNDFFGDIDVSKNYNQIAKVRSNLYQYAYTQDNDATYDMVDLYNLVDGLKYLSPSKANQVLENIENAVSYNWATNSSSRGISIYFPYNAEKIYKNYFLQIYDSFDSFSSYNNFITEFYNVQTSPYNAYSYSSNAIKIDNKNTGADFTLELTDEQKETYAKASYIVFRDNKDGYYLPVYKGNEVNLNENTLSANIKNKQLKIVSTEDSTENILTLFETEVTDEYIKYNTIVTLEDLSSANVADWKMETATISLIYDKKQGTTKIGSVILKNKEEYLPSTVAVDLNDFTNVIFASSSYKVMDKNGKYSEDWESNGVIEGIETNIEEISFELQDFDDGYDYYCVFRIYDTNNNYSYSKMVKMK